MTSLASSMMGGLIGPSSPGMPALPGNLGLPEKSNAAGAVTRGGRDDRTGFVGNSQRAKYEAEYTKAENYNKAFAELLNNQPHLNGDERRMIYEAYSDKFTGNNPVSNGKALTNYASMISNDAPQAQQAPAPAAPAPAAPEPAPAPQQQVAAPVLPTPEQKPQTVGPTPKPQEPAPATTPTVATSDGNIAGKTTTTGSQGTESKGRGRRGRVATLLTGLGGAVERFGL